MDLSIDSALVSWLRWSIGNRAEITGRFLWKCHKNGGIVNVRFSSFHQWILQCFHSKIWCVLRSCLFPFLSSTFIWPHHVSSTWKCWMPPMRKSSQSQFLGHSHSLLATCCLNVCWQKRPPVGFEFKSVVFTQCHVVTGTPKSSPFRKKNQLHPHPRPCKFFKFQVFPRYLTMYNFMIFPWYLHDKNPWHRRSHPFRSCHVKSIHRSPVVNHGAEWPNAAATRIRSRPEIRPSITGPGWKCHHNNCIASG